MKGDEAQAVYRSRALYLPQRGVRGTGPRDLEKTRRTRRGDISWR